MKPRTLARRLETKHGRLRAIRLVGDRLERYRRPVDGDVEITKPARWLIWTVVLSQLLGVPHCEVAEALARRSLHLVRSAA